MRTDISVAELARLAQTNGMPNRNDAELLPIELDQETIARLVRLSIICGDSPEKIAGSLLRNILADDETFNDVRPRRGVELN